MSFKEHLIPDAIQYNIDKDIPLTECVFRRESESFYQYFKFLRENKNNYDFKGMDLELVNSDIGEFGLYEGQEVPLDLPFVDEMDGKEVPEDSLTEEEKKNVELNKPKRNGGPGKKYYVYVKNDKGNVIKVSFGDEKGGLTAKINDEQARKSFAARHNCDTKTDKTKAGYWACRLPYYAKELGLSGGGKFWW